jgi:hypothetical protein
MADDGVGRWSAGTRAIDEPATMSMTVAANEALVRRFVAAYSDGRLHDALELVTEDYFAEDVADQSGRVVRGMDASGDLLRSIRAALPDVREAIVTWSRVTHGSRSESGPAGTTPGPGGWVGRQPGRASNGSASASGSSEPVVWRVRPISTTALRSGAPWGSSHQPTGGS